MLHITVLNRKTSQYTELAVIDYDNLYQVSVDEVEGKRIVTIQTRSELDKQFAISEDDNVIITPRSY